MLRQGLVVRTQTTGTPGESFPTFGFVDVIVLDPCLVIGSSCGGPDRVSRSVVCQEVGGGEVGVTLSR